MQVPKQDCSSNGLQLQPEALLFISSLLKLADPTAKHVELKISLQIQQEQVEADLARRQALAITEAKTCKRFIAIVLEHAKSQGVNPNKLPYLKGKSSEQLRAYINESWPELNTRI